MDRYRQGLIDNRASVSKDVVNGSLGFAAVRATAMTSPGRPLADLFRNV